MNLNIRLYKILFILMLIFTQIIKPFTSRFAFYNNESLPGLHKNHGKTLLFLAGAGIFCFSAISFLPINDRLLSLPFVTVVKGLFILGLVFTFTTMLTLEGRSGEVCR